LLLNCREIPAGEVSQELPSELDLFLWGESIQPSLLIATGQQKHDAKNEVMD
jgi:hypothetical protein